MTEKEFDKLEADINEILYGTIARRFLEEALKFKKELDKLDEHGVFGGYEIQRLKKKFDKVLKVLE